MSWTESRVQRLRERAPRKGGLRAHPFARRGFLFLFWLGILALLTPLLPLAAPAEIHLDEKLEAPGLASLWRQGFKTEQLHGPGFFTRFLAQARVAAFGDGYLAPVLGTDDLGRCLLARILWGARLSLLVGIVASAIGLVIGVLYGLIAGYVGGRADQFMMRFVDVLYALPLMFIVMFVVALLRGYRKEHPTLAIDQILVLFAVIGGISWLTMARVVRAQVLSLKKAPFVEAALCGGSTPFRIARRHLIPNVLPVVLVALTLTIPRVMLLETFLSFLGLGVEAPAVSWGLLARQGFDALTAVHVSWWLIAFPGGILAMTLLAMNVLGDGLRDALDPRLRQ